MFRIALFLLAVLLIPVQAQAHYKHHHPYKATPTHNDGCFSSDPVMRPCMPNLFGFTQPKLKRNYAYHSDRGQTIAHPSIAHPSIAHPSGCPKRAWCGCWLANYLGLFNRSLWVAAKWANLGSRSYGPQPGAIVVWRHHVGLVQAVEKNKILVLSGNDGHRVRERWRTILGVIAYRIL